MEQYLQEVGALTMRWVRRLSREKFSMLFTLFQPMVFWLIFFGNLFQRTANAEVVQAPSYIAFLAAGPGLLGEEPRGLLLDARVSLLADDLPQHGARPAGGNASVDGRPGPAQSHDVGH